MVPASRWIALMSLACSSGWSTARMVSGETGAKVDAAAFDAEGLRQTARAADIR